MNHPRIYPNIKKMSFPLLISLLIPAVLTFLAGCSQGKYQTDNGMIWNTLYSITYQHSVNLNDSILKTFEEVGKSVNAFDDSSVVGIVNSSSDSIRVDKAFIEVYNESLRINRLTNGAFDPTLGPVIAAWGFGKGHTASPDTARIDSLLSFTGISRTHLRGNTLFKDDPRTSFNFSAIAKGYGVDCIAAMLRRNDVDNFLVEVGGEIYASGVSPHLKKWRISIDRPVEGSVEHDSQLIIEISDIGVATSGNYRNYQTGPQGNYGHTINPHTGHPAQTDILSATILAPTCMQADALTTSCMVLGSKNAIPLIQKHKIAAMFVLADHSVWMSPEFKPFVAK